MLKKLFLLIVPLLAVTALADVPQVRSFYPDSSENIQTYRSSSDVYVYFTIGSKIVSATAQLVQNDEVLGTLTFLATSTSSSTGRMKAADNPAISLLQAGYFTIKLYEVTYVEDGETKTYSDANNPLGSTTYLFLGNNGTIVSESGLEGDVLISYYSPEGADGVKTYSFSKAVDPSAIGVNLEYGTGDMPYVTRVPWSMSDDGLTLTIDFRGLDLSSNALAYGNTFYDDEGNPTDPPTVIVLTVSNLNCTDGTMINAEAKDLEGQHSFMLQGRIHKNLHFRDISLPTPVLKSAVFYPASNPADTHTTIVAGCDMMALTVTDAAVLASTDITFTVGQTAVTVPWADIIVDGDVFRCALPAEVIAAGSDALVISLTNYTFTSDDGVQHDIKPLNLANAMKEVTSVAAVKALEVGEQVYLNVPGGVKVTLSNDAGYCFLEDETDGLAILTPDYSKVLNEATLLTGKLAGTYQGYGNFMIDLTKSDYTEHPANTAVGAMVDDIDDVLAGTYEYRLVSIVAGGDVDIESDGYYIYINKVLPVVTDFVEDFVAPEKIDDITGVVYNDPNLNQAYLIIRSMDDINQGLRTNSTKTLAEIKALGAGTEFKADVEDMLVTYCDQMRGISFVEDNTAGVQVTTDRDMPFLSAGKRFTGHIEGMNFDGSSVLFFYEDACDGMVEDADVAFGTLMTASEALLPQNHYRLATFTSDNSTFVADDYGIEIDSQVWVVDMFEVLPYDYSWPSEVQKVTGIVYPFSLGMGGPDDDEAFTTVYIIPRSAADIVASVSDGIKNVETTDSGCIYNIAGVRMHSASKSGIYISNGKKILVK